MFPLYTIRNLLGMFSTISHRQDIDYQESTEDALYYFSQVNIRISYIDQPSDVSTIDYQESTGNALYYFSQVGYQNIINRANLRCLNYRLSGVCQRCSILFLTGRILEYYTQTNHQLTTLQTIRNLLKMLYYFSWVGNQKMI